jgi:hypothetical protein
MAYHIKKTSVLGSLVGTVYYLGNNKWTEIYGDRKVFGEIDLPDSGNYIFKKGWDTTVVVE